MLNHSPVAIMYQPSNSGKSKMPGYHPVFNTKRIRSFLVDLVIDNDHYNDLSFNEKFDFACELIAVAGNEYLYESDLHDVTRYLLKNEDDNIPFVLKKLAVDYYDEVMRTMFDEAAYDFKQERNEWLDKVAKEGDPDEAYERYRNSFI